MSKKFINDLTNDELICYVCRKEIHDLAILRGFFHKKIELTKKESRELKDSVGLHVIPVVVNEEKKKIFRHDKCNPRRFKPTVEDL